MSGEDLICSVHGWDYRIDMGVSAYDNAEVLEKFREQGRSSTSSATPTSFEGSAP